MTHSGGKEDLRDPSFPWWFRAGAASIAVAVFGVIALRAPINDPDTFWHIRAGQWLPTTWQFVGPEPWTPVSSRPWVLHEWLPELFLGRVELWWGLTGVSWAWAVGVLLVAATVFVITRRRSFTLLAGLVTATTMIGMSGSLTPRPHLVTFALTAVFVDAWLRTLDDLRPRWWLVVASWLWACSHGMWFLGPTIGLVVLVGGLIDGRIPRQRLARLVTLAVATAVAGALTPLGPRLLLAPLHVGEYTQFVAEWQPAALLHPSMLAFMSLAGVVVMIWARSSRPIPWSGILVLAMAVGLALLYARTVAVGAAAMAPVAASTLQSTLRIRRERWGWREVLVLVTTCAVALVGTATLGPGKLGTQDRGPEGLSGHLAALPAGTVVCNDYDIGGWLLWRFPGLHPAVDGRAEVYSVEHIQASARFQSGYPGWTDYLEETDCGAAVMLTDTPIVEDLREAGWTTSVEASEYSLLVASSDPDVSPG